MDETMLKELQQIKKLLIFLCLKDMKSQGDKI
jgi:hypothetical protein